MKRIPRNDKVRQGLLEDQMLARLIESGIAENYDAINMHFHSHFQQPHRDHFIQNANYHRLRYLALLDQGFSGRVLDIGNDKPFLSYLLASHRSDIEIETVSFEVPESPIDLYAVDIEADPLPFDDESFDWVIFTEVIEHLWRDPSYVLFQINRVLKQEGQVFITTPNACERHAITSILWQSNPNQRGKFYRHLESGHLHLWTVKELEVLLQADGFEIESMETQDLYGYTTDSEEIDALIQRVSPYSDLMGEAIVCTAKKLSRVAAPAYPVELFPDGTPALFEGAVRSFAAKFLLG